MEGKDLEQWLKGLREVFVICFKRWLMSSIFQIPYNMQMLRASSSLSPGCSYPDFQYIRDSLSLLWCDWVQWVWFDSGISVIRDFLVYATGRPLRGSEICKYWRKLVEWWIMLLANWFVSGCYFSPSAAPKNTAIWGES